MANTNYPYWGIQPLFMADARKTALILPITNNYGTALAITDPVLAVTAGRIERASTTGACLGVALEYFRKPAAAAFHLSGLIPVQYVTASYSSSYDHYALVAVDPSLFFTMQEDGVTSSLTQALNWAACDFAFTTSVNTTTGMSGVQIDSNTADNTATRPLQLVSPYANWYDVDAGAYNAVTASTSTAGQYGKWIVRIFNHQMGPGSLAVAFA